MSVIITEAQFWHFKTNFQLSDRLVDSQSTNMILSIVINYWPTSIDSEIISHNAVKYDRLYSVKKLLLKAETLSTETYCYVRV